MGSASGLEPWPGDMDSIVRTLLHEDRIDVQKSASTIDSQGGHYPTKVV
jgi:hypothetical protein